MLYDAHSLTNYEYVHKKKCANSVFSNFKQLPVSPFFPQVFCKSKKIKQLLTLYLIPECHLPTVIPTSGVLLHSHRGV